MHTKRVTLPDTASERPAKQLNEQIADTAHLDRVSRKLQSVSPVPVRSPLDAVNNQEKYTRIEEVLNQADLGLFVIDADGTIRLIKKVSAYLAAQRNALPEALWAWVKQGKAEPDQNALSSGIRCRLRVEVNGRRLMIGIVSDHLLAFREESRTPVKPLPANLTPREVEVLRWISLGKTNKEAGLILHLSPRTVQKHLEHIYQKLGVETRTGAAAKAYQFSLQVLEDR